MRGKFLQQHERFGNEDEDAETLTEHTFRRSARESSINHCRGESEHDCSNWMHGNRHAQRPANDDMVITSSGLPTAIADRKTA